MPETPRTRASRLSSDRRTEIFDATLRLVIAHGYEATPMDQVAAATRTSKATLYRHWRDKSTLVMTAVAERSGIRLETIDTGTLTGDLTALMKMLATRADQNIPLAVALAQAASHDQQLRDVVDRFLLPQLPVLDAIAARAVERGEIPDTGRLRHLPHLLIGALLTPAFLGRTDETVDEQTLLEYLHEVILPVIGSPLHYDR